MSIFHFTFPAFFYDNYEELYRGAVAREIALGTPLTLWDYRADDYAGGFYPVVLFLSALQPLLGFSMLSLKLAGIFQTAFTWLVWYVILARGVNTRTAVFFSLIYIFAPFTYILLSSAVLGDHAETCLLTALTVYLFFKQTARVKPAVFSSFALGLLGGFSLWFAYIYAVTLLSLAIYGLMTRRNFCLHPAFWLPAFAGFLLGFSPWIVLNSASPLHGVIVHGVPFWESFSFSQNFFFLRLLQDEKFIFNWQDPRELFRWSYLGILALFLTTGSFLLLRKNRRKIKPLFRSPAGLALVYIPVFLLVQQIYTVTGLRFLVPLFPFCAIIAACMLAGLYKTHRLVSLAGAVLISGIGITTCVLAYQPNLAGEYLARKGYSIKALTLPAASSDRIAEALKKDTSSLRPSDISGYLILLLGQMDLQPSSASFEILEKMPKVPENYRLFFAYQAGREFFDRHPRLVEVLKSLEPLKTTAYYPFAVRGVFRSLIFTEIPDFDLEEVKKQLPPELQYKLGVYEGWHFASNRWEKSPSLENLALELKTEIVRHRNPEEKDRFLRGVGRFLFRTWVQNTDHPLFGPQEIETHFSEYLEGVFRGITSQMIRKHVLSYSSPLVWQWNAFTKDLTPESRKKITRAIQFSIRQHGLSKETLTHRKLKDLEIYWE